MNSNFSERFTVYKHLATISVEKLNGSTQSSTKRDSCPLAKTVLTTNFVNSLLKSYRNELKMYTSSSTDNLESNELYQPEEDITKIQQYPMDNYSGEREVSEDELNFDYVSEYHDYGHGYERGYDYGYEHNYEYSYESHDQEFSDSESLMLEENWFDYCVDQAMYADQN
ncbi:hypothetical protein BB560_000340 [Smittium megazygosporum]|uniref:Uncharacterized protein n=1 Tax=Smittium megazygosporum TaxID=133381 RepID=A0A2T9ZKK4_9FUNG|nr:hypothetical protein BB560_000340 [Smittium megazygosporum]